MVVWWLYNVGVGGGCRGWWVEVEAGEEEDGQEGERGEGGEGGGEKERDQISLLIESISFNPETIFFKVELMKHSRAQSY